jgi:hypothetical protein
MDPGGCLQSEDGTVRKCIVLHVRVFDKGLKGLCFRVLNDTKMDIKTKSLQLL